MWLLYDAITPHNAFDTLGLWLFRHSTFDEMSNSSARFQEELRPRVIRPGGHGRVSNRTQEDKDMTVQKLGPPLLS